MITMATVILSTTSWAVYSCIFLNESQGMVVIENKFDSTLLSNAEG